MTITVPEITAREREILGKLCFWKDTRTTYTAQWIAESIGSTAPATLGALQSLKRQGMVWYFPGHPGLWEATGTGRRLVGR